MKKSNNNSEQHRDDLTGKRAFTDISQLILFIFFITILIFDSFFLKKIYFFADYFSSYIRIPIALMILFFAIWLVINGIRIVFGEIREKPHIITKGVFSIVRHPIYLGAMLIYFTLFIFTLSILSSVIFIVIVVFYCGISLSEEKLLVKRFGAEYKKYMQNVPMLFPYKIKMKRKEVDEQN